ncbi:MAG: phosphopantetheine adenylyltransferase [Myxococcota bacterium]
MNRLAAACFAIAAVIHLIPILGALSASRLESLYGFPVDAPSLEIVLRHRAVTIALVGALLAVAVVRPELRGLAGLVGLASMGTYVLFVLLVGDANAALLRVLYVDLVGIVVLGAGLTFDRARLA